MPYLLPGPCSAPVKALVSSLKAPPAAGVLLTLQGLENRNCLTTCLFMWGGRGRVQGPSFQEVQLWGSCSGKCLICSAGSSFSFFYGFVEWKWD